MLIGGNKRVNQARIARRHYSIINNGINGGVALAHLFEAWRGDSETSNVITEKM